MARKKINFIIFLFILIFFIKCTDNVNEKENNKFFQSEKYNKEVIEAKQQREELFNNLKKVSNDSDTYRKIGNTYSREFKFDEAIKYYNKAIELNTNNYMAHFELGFTHIKIDEYKKAINFFKKQLGLTELDGLSYYFLAYCYYQIGDYTNANDNLNKFFDFDLDSKEGIAKIIKEKGKKSRTEMIPAAKALKKEIQKLLN